VRGAIDLVAVAESLAGLVDHEDYGDRVLDASHLALSARISVDETSELTPEQVITGIWDRLRPPP
jgi:MoxR-like ATPase